MAVKRILLADADPLVAEGFRHALGERWEIAVAASGPAALEEMKKGTFDVLIADIDLPEVSGAELLNRIRKKYPNTVRFILATEADRERVMKDVLGAQQFLAKPVDPGTLAPTLERALALDVWIASGTIRELVARIRSFPTIPSLYLEVQAALRSPHATTEEVGSIMAKDMAMMTKLLQVINSAYFGLPRRITDPAEAVGLLGFETVKSMVVAIKLLGQYDKLKPIYFSIDRLWRHSMEIANLAKDLTLLHTHDRALADLAYTAGLMHDLGKVVLAANFEEQYQGAQSLARKQQVLLWEVEKELFGAHHGEIGAYLLGLWGMPLEVLEVAALHHQPARSTNQGFTALTAVHVANAFENEAHPDNEDSEISRLDQEYLVKNGLTPYVEGWRQAVASRDFTRPPTLAAKPAESKSLKPRSTSSPVVREPRLAGKPEPGALGDRWPLWRQPLSYAGAGVAGFAVVFLLLRTTFSPSPAQIRAQEPADDPTATTAALPSSTTAVTGVQPASPPATVSPVTAPELPAKPVRAQDSSSSPSEGATRLRVAKPAPSESAARFKLQGIFYSPNRPTAIVNGQAVQVNDTIGGARVVDIQATSVTMEFQGQRQTLKLL